MTTEASNKFVEASLKRASEALRGAGILLKNGELFGAVSRAYYCVLHAARAILYSKGITTKSHSGVRSLFGEQFVKPGIMDKEFADILRDAFDARQLGDYEIYAEFGRDEVEILVNKAGRFLKAVNSLLKKT